MEKIKENVGQHQPGHKPKDKAVKEVTERTIQEAVFAQLGKPPRLARVIATKMSWDSTKWRVTIYSHRDESFAEHPDDGFFLKVDEEGAIVSSNPPIKKKY